MKIKPKNLVRGFIVLMSFALQGCAQTISTRWVTDRYGLTEVHWIKPVEHIDHVLILGQISDPATTNGDIVVQVPFNSVPLFRDTNLHRIDVYSNPFVPPSQIWNFGPKSGEPEGIYSFELKSKGSPECTPYEQAMSVAEVQLSTPQHRYLRPTNDDTCIVYRYLGALQKIKSDDYIIVQYRSKEALKLGYDIIVSELRRGEHHLLARQVTCSGFRNGPSVPNCIGSNNILSLLNSPVY